MNKKIGMVLAAVLVGGAAIWLATRGGGEAAGTITASGTVEATDAQLGFLLPGRVAEVVPTEGTTVMAGAELASLDAREVDAQVAAARADVDAARAALAELEAGARGQDIASAEAALRSAETRVREADQNADRARTLFDGGAISRQALDRAEAERDAAQASADQARERLDLIREGAREETLRAARARHAQAEARLTSAEASRSNAVIVAPFEGIVTIRHREPGETVPAGAPVLTLLDPSDRWVRIYVREDRLGAVRMGARASIVSDTYPDRLIEGEVIFIGSEAEFTPRNVQTAEERIRLVYPVKVRITGDPDFVLKPGLPADVTLELGGT